MDYESFMKNESNECSSYYVTSWELHIIETYL